MLFNICMDTHNSFVNVNPNTCIHWTWTPKFTNIYEYAIDWLTPRRGHDSIVTAPNFSAHFTYVTIVCAESCRSLVESRKHYKHMKSKSRIDINKSQELICDQIQYVLKISANSMYKALSYSEYNTYSPVCGMGGTEGGRWYLNVAMSVCWCMGFDIVYGDTDSIMFTIPVKVSMNRRYPMILYVASMMNDMPTLSLHTVSKYISG